MQTITLKYETFVITFEPICWKGQEGLVGFLNGEQVGMVFKHPELSWADSVAQVAAIVDGGWFDMLDMLYDHFIEQSKLDYSGAVKFTHIDRIEWFGPQIDRAMQKRKHRKSRAQNNATGDLRNRGYKTDSWKLKGYNGCGKDYMASERIPGKSSRKAQREREALWEDAMNEFLSVRYGTDTVWY